jgi:hypothetical protein
MYGGTIAGNTNSVVNVSVGNGAGGVYVSDGRFSMFGGAIVGNRQTGGLARAAGGVYLANTSRFYMQGGTLEGNSSQPSASGNGGGIFVIGTSMAYFSGSPQIKDGLFSSAALSSVLRVDGDLTREALVTIEGSGSAGQMEPNISVTGTYSKINEEMANAFVSADGTLLGTVTGNRVVWAENFEISLEPAGDRNFGSVVYGYDAQSGHTVTINNSRRATGLVTIGLSGPGADAFTLSRQAISNIGINERDDFTVGVKTGLPAGVYTAAVTVSIAASRDAPANFGVSFTVVPKEITVSPSDIVYNGKVYDGTVAVVGGPAMITLSAASGIVYGDAVAASFAAAAFDDKNAGYGLRSVTFEGLTLRGGAAGNYRLADASAVKTGVSIFQREATLKADDKIAFIGASVTDVRQTLTYTLVGLVEGDDPADVITSGPLYNIMGAYFPTLSQGRYIISPHSANAVNYRFTYRSGSLTVSEHEDISGDIVFESAVYEYNGAPQSPLASLGGSGDNFTYHYFGVYGYDSNIPPVNAGSYIVEALYENENNGHIGRALAVFRINPKPITVSGADHTKVYDGARNAFGIDVTLDGVVSGDNVSVAAVTAMYESSNAGTTAINITSVRLAGADSVNYTVTVPVTVAVAGITPKSITEDMFTVAPQTYAGAERRPIPAANDDGRAVTFSVDGYSDNINVGAASVTVSGTGNYTGTLTLGFPIGRVRLIVAARSLITVYGEPAPPLAVDYIGFVNGETPGVLDGALSLVCDYRVGDDAGDYSITPSGLLSDNYDIRFLNGVLTVDLRAAVINVAVSGREYDGGTSVTVLSSSVSNIYVDGSGAVDDVVVVPGTASFVDKNAGAAKLVAFSGWSLNGAKAGNYYLIRQPSVTAEITPIEITVSPNDIVYSGKVYDGTTAVVGAPVIALTAASGIIPGDVFAASFASAVFDDKNAGLRRVTFSGLTLRGADAGNYRLSTASAVKENITISPRDLILKADNKLVFADSPAVEPDFFTYTLAGAVEGERREEVITSAPAFALGSGYVDNSTPGQYAIIPSGAAAANYNITFQNGILTVSGKMDVSGEIVFEDAEYVYDGQPKTVTVGYSGPSGYTVAYHYVGLTGRGETYDSDAPPTDAGSYIVNAILEDDDHIGKAMAAFTIAPKPLTLSGAEHTKVYDGARNAFGIRVTLDGIVGDDDVSAAGITAMYASPSAGTTALDIISMRLAGADSSNYTVTVPATVTVAGITPKEITAEMFTVADQVFTGSERRPMPSANDGGNSVTFGIDGYQNNINPGTALVTVSGTGNYGGTLTLGFSITPTTSGGGDGGDGGTGGGTVVEDSTGTVVGAGWGTIEIADWTYGGAPSVPVLFSATNGVDNVVIEYKRRDEPDNAYVRNVPVTSGEYTVRAVFAATAYYSECSATADFQIYRSHQDRPYIPGIEEGIGSTPSYVPGLPADVPRIPAVLSGLTMDVTASSVKFIFMPEIPEMDRWEYSIDGGNSWQTNPEIRSLAPNSEYVILIRKRETENFPQSDLVAVLIRTLVAGAGEIAAFVPETRNTIDTRRDAANRYGIMLERRIVSGSAEFMVITPENSNVNVAIYNNMGNVVFRRSGVMSGESVTWDLAGPGRAVANGSYLIVAVSRDKNGKVYRYSSLLGVRR